MIYPIVAYGHPILRQKAADIKSDFPDLQEFIKNLWETMYATDGIGLAAPQVNRAIRIFVIDATVLAKNYPETTGFKKTFINAYKINEGGDAWLFNEGCLSIPDIHEDVSRPKRILLHYLDENFDEHEEWFEGAVARTIQHEYDHLEGILFTDYLSPMRKTMLARKLNNIALGNIETKYRMIFPRSKKQKR
ncbi:MAG TPA: peptide deformylase [Bacteroidales bacterium]|jgi:peptide deformylase|nr:peptide deformylase [Bacteroidales bacterium]MDI9574042.1 peptide deformylase [Bacteroidota bacterium]OQC58919.1 MAG: Peptide deformylase [Bacteroidetes bacterium ADurb.Bin012]MBP9512507.1 peptide deformylase [Bacteroidales bacterium]MBP9588996.1 peptide deformylase [Bacteroidales bacterium]